MLELLLNITTNKSANPNSKISEAVAKGSLDLQALQTGQDWLFKVILPLLIIMIYAVIVGLERRNLGKAVGVSAYFLVGIASCSIAITQRLMFELNAFQPNEGQRIIAQVVAGVSFIGAGVIIKDKMSIKGLTTASSIWACAILGLILGSGYLLIGVIGATVIIIYIFIRDMVSKENPFVSCRNNLIHKVKQGEMKAEDANAILNKEDDLQTRHVDEFKQH